MPVDNNVLVKPDSVADQETLADYIPNLDYDFPMDYKMPENYSLPVDKTRTPVILTLFFIEMVTALYLASKLSWWLTY